MHPDVGAIIGISLAGSVLVVALLFLCMLYLPWPCCKNGIQPRVGNGNRRIGRPSTSSHSPFANFEVHRNSRNIDQLSAIDLQNQAHFYSRAGIVNPLWQMHCTCHSPGMLTASQQSLNFAHYHSVNSCQFHHHQLTPQMNQVNIAGTDRAITTADPSFQYFTPQLHSPSDSPPPYPGLDPEDTSESSSHQSANANISTTNNPPPYSPKH